VTWMGTPRKDVPKLLAAPGVGSLATNWPNAYPTSGLQLCLAIYVIICLTLKRNAINASFPRQNWTLQREDPYGCGSHAVFAPPSHTSWETVQKRIELRPHGGHSNPSSRANMSIEVWKQVCRHWSPMLRTEI
jgi:hypothetical protein